ncbi:MAG TPA: hypothetical protein VLH61_12420 [Bacteroidales bacterium]|nr:hypothetical protein [Bacteroidales bacterium]
MICLKESVLSMILNAGSLTERKGQMQLKHITENPSRSLQNDTPSGKKYLRVLPSDSQEAVP